MTRYTHEDLIPRLQAIIAAKPEGYVYEQRILPGETSEGCYYQWEGAPDCIVGHLLHGLGVSIAEFEMMDRFGKVIGDLHGHLSGLGLEFTPSAWDLMILVQVDQDNGISWARSLEYAIESIERNVKP